MFFLLLIFNPAHFALCYTLINVDSPGVHNFVTTSDNLVQINIPESFQAFVFSNIDMGKYNSFSVDEIFLPAKYGNMFAIAFNGSSTISILSKHKSNQNMAVFIIPDHICDQHSFYAMSKKVFKIEIKTKKLNYNLKTCGFSPSFATNVNRKVSFGYSNKINASAQIFYGFTSKSTSKKNSLKNSNFEKVIEKHNQNFIHKSKHIKHQNKIIDKLNFNKNQLYQLKSVEKFSKQENNFFNANSNIERIGPNILTNDINSPGFLVSNSVESEVKTLNTVNTTYFVSYRVNQINVDAKIIFERDFDVAKDSKESDNSMLTKHFDFLVYYDKNTSTYIYDNKWSASNSISYQSDSLAFIKWVWVSIITLFAIVFLIIIIRLICILKSNCLKKNNDHSLNDDYNLSELGNEQAEYHNLNYRNNYDNRTENELETFCYQPNLDDEILYENENYKKKNKSKRNVYSNQYEYNEEESTEEISANNSNKQTNKLNENINDKKFSLSPYRLDESQCDDVDENLFNEKNDDVDNIEEIPNPYGLPFISGKTNSGSEEDNSD